MEGDGELPVDGDCAGTRAGKMDRVAIVDEQLLPSVLLLKLLFVAGALLALLYAVRALLGLALSLESS